MRLFERFKCAALTRYFSKLPGFSKPEEHSLHFLNLAQFMGVINDNLFKFVIAFLLIGIQGTDHASSILSKTGIVFTIPFLLFSSAAGVLADKFSKQRLLIGMKIAEMLIMGLAILAFGMRSAPGSYILLFLLATHSALFGPAKYAIISELVPSDRISRANGLITSFTYLGIILGTFLASFITEITDKNFTLVACFCLFIAVMGFIGTFGIRHTPPQRSSKKIDIFFLREIFTTLRFCSSRKQLLTAITGAAYFLFIGAFTQLNMIPFAINSLGLSDIYGGYLILATSLGIALGAYIAGKASRSRVELGLSCVGGFALSFLLPALAFLHFGTLFAVFLLILLGVAGGLFIVPFDSFVQLFSPDEKRGQVIAANNFLSFCGVFMASLTLYIYSEVFNLTPAQGFAITGGLTFCLSLWLLSRLSNFALPYLSRKILLPFLKPTIVDLELLDKETGRVLILRNSSPIKSLMLMAVAPKIHILIPRKKKRAFPWFSWTFYSVDIVDISSSVKSLLNSTEKVLGDELIPCIVQKGEEVAPLLSHASFFDRLLYVDIAFMKPGSVITFSKMHPEGE